MVLLASYPHDSDVAAMIDVVWYMEQWARWRVNDCRTLHGSAPVCMTGKLLSGMGTGICPSCKGAGRMPCWLAGSKAEFIDPCPTCHGWGRARSGDLQALEHIETNDCAYCKDEHGISRGEVNGVTCFKCHGIAKRIDISLHVNPAGIRGTRFNGANEDGDPISMMIDRTVAGWQTRDETIWFHIVSIIEYAMGGTQEHKADAARRHYRRMTNYRKIKNISQSWYTKNLHLAHSVIERKLHEMLDSQS